MQTENYAIYVLYFCSALLRTTLMRAGVFDAASPCRRHWERTEAEDDERGDKVKKERSVVLDIRIGGMVLAVSAPTGHTYN